MGGGGFFCFFIIGRGDFVLNLLMCFFTFFCLLFCFVFNYFLSFVCFLFFFWGGGGFLIFYLFFFVVFLIFYFACNLGSPNSVCFKFCIYFILLYPKSPSNSFFFKFFFNNISYVFFKIINNNIFSVPLIKRPYL